MPLTAALWLDLQGIVTWYRFEIPRTLRRMSIAVWITVAIGVAALLTAYFYVDSQLSPGGIAPDKLAQAGTAVHNALISGFPAGVLFRNNLQVELAIIGLGIFSFSVLGMVVYIGNLALIGGVLAGSKILGLSPLLIFASGILPHAIFELPSVVLASSAVLYLGVELVTPKDGRSIGEAFIVLIAHLFKIMLGLCVPLLILAALVEARITPVLFDHFIGNALRLH